MENLSSVDMVTQQLLTSSLGLPSDKENTEAMLDETAVERINRTGESERWYWQAHRLDVERGTELGTLGYLPPEVLEQIWKDVVNYDAFNENGLDMESFHLFTPISMQTLRDQVFDAHGRHSTLMAACKLQKALGNSSFELDHFFNRIERACFSNYTFVFYHPTELKTFLDIVCAAEAKQPFRFQVWSFNDTRRSIDRLRQHEKRRQNQRDWIDAFTWFPPNTLSVEFGLAKVQCLERDIWLLEVLSKRFARNAPEAAISVWSLWDCELCRIQPLRSQKQCVIIDKVLSDIERPGREHTIAGR